ncbi:MAG: hypothetical protein JWP51_1652 [Bradyrhizobium sp.]|jgi:hypothetical protein|nr:hypothetical protein [Bradyrhizobium sp.]
MPWRRKPVSWLLYWNGPVGRTAGFTIVILYCIDRERRRPVCGHKLIHRFAELSVICEVAGDGHRNLKFNLFNGVRGFRTYIDRKRIRRSGEILMEFLMSNTAVKIASVCFVVLALPTASFARGGGGVGGARGGGSAAMGSRPNAGAIGAAQSQVTDPSGIGNASRVAPIPPPRISVPTIPQFK